MPFVVPLLCFAAEPLPLQGPLCGIYGFDPGSAAFKGLKPGDAAAKLSSWGVNAVFGGYEDPALRKALRGRGIRVFAELACFVGEKHWDRFPRSRPVNEVGEPIRKVRWYAGVCPSQDWLRADIVKRARRLAGRRELDGIWLDFIRYPGHWEVPEPHLEQTCFCPVCLRSFGKEAGVSFPKGLSLREKAHWILADHKEAWVRFKTGVIASLAQEVREAVRAASRTTLVGAFTVPWAKEERRGAVVEILGQDRRELGSRLDALSPMAYHVLMGRPAGWIPSAVAEAAAESGRPVWPAVFAGDKAHPLSAAQLATAVEAAWAEPSQGVILFSFGELERAGRLGEIPALFQRCR